MINIHIPSSSEPEPVGEPLQPHENEDWSLELDYSDPAVHPTEKAPAKLSKQTHSQINDLLHPTTIAESKDHLSLQDVRGILLVHPAVQRMLTLRGDLHEEQIKKYCPHAFSYNDLTALSKLIETHYMKGVLKCMEEKSHNTMHGKAPLSRDALVRRLREDPTGKTMLTVPAIREWLTPLREALARARKSLETEERAVHAQIRWDRQQNEPQATIEKTWLPPLRWISNTLEALHLVEQDIAPDETA